MENLGVFSLAYFRWQPVPDASEKICRKFHSSHMGDNLSPSTCQEDLMLIFKI